MYLECNPRQSVVAIDASRKPRCKYTNASLQQAIHETSSSRSKNGNRFGRAALLTLISDSREPTCQTIEGAKQ
jgi:hypothetical protein